MFVGSALTNFGVRMLLDAVVELAPSPSPRLDRDDEPRALDSPFSAFVFKVQANMDPSHRDRIAFARICSGKFERGHERDQPPHRPRHDHQVRHHRLRPRPRDGRRSLPRRRRRPGQRQRRATRRHAVRRRLRRAGVEFPPIPRFSPEVFAKARPLDNGRFKQFRKGLDQLDEEGVVQVLRDPDIGDIETILAAVGELQFEVFAYRLGSEFGAPTEILSAPYQAIRLTDKESGERLRRIGGIRILTRGDGALVALFENRYRLQRLEERRARADAAADRRRLIELPRHGEVHPDVAGRSRIPGARTAGLPGSASRRAADTARPTRSAWASTPRSTLVPMPWLRNSGSRATSMTSIVTIGASTIEPTHRLHRRRARSSARPADGRA